MDASEITASAEPLVKYIRSAPGKSKTHILFAEGLPFGRNWAVPDAAKAQQSSNAALHAAYSRIRAAGWLV
jgi:hypothetical protein